MLHNEVYLTLLLICFNNNIFKNQTEPTGNQAPIQSINLIKTGKNQVKLGIGAQTSSLACLIFNIVSIMLHLKK